MSILICSGDITQKAKSLYITPSVIQIVKINHLLISFIKCKSYFPYIVYFSFFMFLTLGFFSSYLSYFEITLQDRLLSNQIENGPRRGLQNTKYKIQNTKYKIQNTKYKE